MNERHILDFVGRTPLVRLSRMAPHVRLFAKVESANPGGSVKDRAALAMVVDAEERGLLEPGGTIVEATSGNTGIGLAVVAAAKGYHLVLTMPEHMNVERRNLLKWLGAEIILTPSIEGMTGAVFAAGEEAKRRGGFLTKQFENPANPDAHRRTTALEILEDTGGHVDVFVAGVGTGGTITGVGQVLKEKVPGVTVVGVEPAGSPVLSGGRPGRSRIFGLGAGFKPAILDMSVIDRIVPVADAEAFECAGRVAREEGVLAGISSGAALFAALEVAKERARDDVIVVIFPDSAERYLSVLEGSE